MVLSLQRTLLPSHLQVQVELQTRSHSPTASCTAMDAAHAQLKEQAKLKIEEEVAGDAPGCVKPFFICCGGPVGTVEKCMCMVAAEKQDNVKKAIEKYRKL